MGVVSDHLRSLVYNQGKDATRALAKIQGQVIGAINGAAAAGSAVPLVKTRDSAGQKVEGSLAMQALRASP